MMSSDDQWSYSEDRLERARRRNAQILRTVLLLAGVILLSVLTSALGPLQFG